jgi:hypothetical protein
MEWWCGFLFLDSDSDEDEEPPNPEDWLGISAEFWGTCEICQGDDSELYLESV